MTTHKRTQLSLMKLMQQSISSIFTEFHILDNRHVSTDETYPNMVQYCERFGLRILDVEPTLPYGGAAGCRMTYTLGRIVDWSI